LDKAAAAPMTQSIAQQEILTDFNKALAAERARNALLRIPSTAETAEYQKRKAMIDEMYKSSSTNRALLVPHQSQREASMKAWDRFKGKGLVFASSNPEADSRTILSKTLPNAFGLLDFVHHTYNCYYPRLGLPNPFLTVNLINDIDAQFIGNIRKSFVIASYIDKDGEQLSAPLFSNQKFSIDDDMVQQFNNILILYIPYSNSITRVSVDMTHLNWRKSWEKQEAETAFAAQQQFVTTTTFVSEDLINSRAIAHRIIPKALGSAPIEIVLLTGNHRNTLTASIAAFSPTDKCHSQYLHPVCRKGTPRHALVIGDRNDEKVRQAYISPDGLNVVLLVNNNQGTHKIVKMRLNKDSILAAVGTHSKRSIFVESYSEQKLTELIMPCLAPIVYADPSQKSQLEEPIILVSQSRVDDKKILLFNLADQPDPEDTTPYTVDLSTRLAENERIVILEYYVLNQNLGHYNKTQDRGEVNILLLCAIRCSRRIKTRCYLVNWKSHLRKTDIVEFPNIPNHLTYRSKILLAPMPLQYNVYLKGPESEETVKADNVTSFNDGIVVYLLSNDVIIDSAVTTYQILDPNYLKLIGKKVDDVVP
jgi:hypothetical protein